MHTYRKTDDGKWQAGHNDGKSFMPLGPAFVDQCWAAAFASTNVRDVCRTMPPRPWLSFPATGATFHP